MYDKYEQKIIKRAKVLHKFYKLRILVISLFTLGMITSSGYLFGKGRVINGINPKQVYTYGDSITFEAKAILSEVSYEFRKEASEVWSSEVPQKVGTYHYRPRGNNNFAKYYYGTETSFSIVPKKINVTVNEKQLTYGTKPTVKVEGNFIGSDKLDDEYDFIYENRDTLKWDIAPDIKTLMVFNSAAEDVTNCYEFISEPQTVIINKRTLILQTNSEAKTYDNEALVNEKYHIASGTLVEGEKLEVITNSVIKDVGKINNNLGFKVTTDEGVDVSLFYVISLQPGNLEIYKRKIEFSSKSYEYVYDGVAKKYSIDDVFLSSAPETLLPKQNFSITLTNNDNYIDVANYTNTFSATIIDDGVDVSPNYDISYKYGKTTITKRKIIVFAGSLEKTYDKKVVQLVSYTLDPETPLALKDEIVEVSAKAFIDSGTYDNEQILTLVDRATRVNVDKNYEIVTENGTVIINKKPLTVNIKKLTRYYDGKEHSHQLADLDYNPYDIIDSDELVLTNSTKVRDVGEYTNSDFALDIVDKKTGLSNLKNYDVTINGAENSIVIQKLTIGIKVVAQTKLYDEQKIVDTLEPGTERFEITSGQLGIGDYIDFTYVNNPHNAGEYGIQSEIKIMRKAGMLQDPLVDVDVTTNYDITIENETFGIAKRKLIIETLDVTHEYNRILAFPAKSELYSVRAESDGLVDNHYIKSFTVTADFVDVGAYNYAIDIGSFAIENGNGEDVTANYDVTFINAGKRIITPREITIAFDEASKMYDGDPFSSSKHTSTRLLENDWIDIQSLPEVTHVFEGEVTNPGALTTYKIFTEDGLDVSANYAITEIATNVIYRTPRPISLSSTSHSKVFDNKPFASGEVSVGGEGLAKGDVLFIEDLVSQSSAKHVVDSGLNTFTYVIKNGDGLDVTANYDIDIIYGTIAITPLELVIKMIEVNHEYNGRDHGIEVNEQIITKFSSPLYIDEGELIDGFTLVGTIIKDEPIINVGTYGIYMYGIGLTHETEDVDWDDFRIYFSDEKPYNISERNITVQSASGSKEFDEKPFDQTVTITSGSLAPGDVISYTEVEGVIGVGENQLNNIGQITITNSEGVDVTDNYKITKILGRVTIYVIY